MAAKKNPLSEKAYEMYKSGMKLVDIAAKLDVPPGTVRRWKNNHNWDSERSESVSWVSIEHDYVTDIRKKPCTLEELANKYNIPVKTIKDRCKRGGYSQKWSKSVNK